MTYKNLYVQLARLGDQLNLLPLLWRDAQEGARSAMMVHEQYAPHLENSYCDIIPWKGDTHDLAGAVAEASKIGKPIVTQVLGPVETVREFTYRPAGLEHAVTTSYQKESWRVAGRLGDWDYCFPLVLDRRSPRREAELMPSRKRFILAALDGISSPFPYKKLVLELLKLTKIPVIELSELRPERFFDLLALYEKATCLVAIDSAPLHLSRAVPDLPVVALANDRPLLWNGSVWRPQFIWYCRYSDFPLRAHEMVQAIKDIPVQGPAELPRIVHVWNSYEGADCHTPKSNFAQWVRTPIQIGMCGRDSAMVMNDPKRYPYLRDCIRMGTQRARANDWVCVSRPNLIFEPGATQALVSKTASYAYRISSKDGGRTFCPVGELFCATKSWWTEQRDLIPDFVMGTDHYWPHGLIGLFKMRGGVDITGCCHREDK